MSRMTPEIRRALARAFLRALHPDAGPERPTTEPSGELVDAGDVAALHVELHALVEARLRQIPHAIADQLTFAARQGSEAVRTLLETAIDDALRELAAHGGTADDGRMDAAL